MTVSGAFKYANEVSNSLANKSAAEPLIWESTITYFNSCVGYLMDFSLMKNTRGSAFLRPANIGWIIPIIFQQTFCISVIAFMLPFVILRWKVLGGILFGLAAWWSGRWVWYSTFSILLAEFSVVYLPLMPETWTLNLYGKRNIQVGQKVIPLFILSLGVLLKYLWTIFPTHLNDELVAHVDPTSGNLMWNPDPLTATPRVDDFFIVSSSLLFLEISPLLRKGLDQKWLKLLGSLAFSSFLTSGTVMLAVGSVLRHHLISRLHWTSDSPLVLFVLFLSCVPSALIFSLIWKMIVDDGSLSIARYLYKWFTVE